MHGKELDEKYDFWMKNVCVDENAKKIKTKLPKIQFKKNCYVVVWIGVDPMPS